MKLLPPPLKNDPDTPMIPKTQNRCMIQMKMKPTNDPELGPVRLLLPFSPLFTFQLYSGRRVNVMTIILVPAKQYKLLDPDPIQQLTTLSGKSSKTSICTTF